MSRSWLKAALGIILIAAGCALPAVAQVDAEVGILTKQVESLAKDEKHAQATPLAEQALALAERMLGADHPDTLRSVKNLGDLYRRQGRNDEAERLLKRALEGRERVLGAEHADTVASFDDLAALYQDMKRFQDAEPLAQRGLRASERLHGDDHDDTLKAILRLTMIYLGQGDHTQAEPLLRRTLDIHERRAGIDAAQTLNPLLNLGHFYRGHQRFSEADPLFRRAVAISERVLGAEHPETLAAMSGLGVLYKDAGRHREAESIFLRVLEARERVFGRDAAETLASLDDLAQLYRSQSRFAEAEPLIRRSLEASERTLGAEHPDTLYDVHNLALLYRDQGRYDEAEPLGRRAFEGRERVLGPDDDDTRASRTNLVLLYQAKGRYEEATSLVRRAFERAERGLGPDHPETLNNLGMLAGLYRLSGRYGEAEPLYQRALAAFERLRGKDHIQTFTIVSNLAELYATQGRYDDAEPLFRRAFETAERTLGAENRITLRSLNNLAGINQRQERYGEAEALYRRALQAHERILGAEHPDTLLILNNLASVYYARGQLSEALPIAQRAMEASERVLGDENPQTLTAIANLATVYRNLQRIGEAEPLYQRAMAAGEHLLGAEHPTTLEITSNFALLHFNQGNWRRAAELWERSVAALIQRTRRGTQSTGQGVTGQRQTEAEQREWQFWGLAKALYRLHETKSGAASAAAQMFQIAQWAQNSEAAQSLAQMTARGAAGNAALSAMARERQDLVAEWQVLDGLRIAALGATAPRDAAAEAKNRARLAAIEARILAIDAQLSAQFPDYAALASPEALSVKEVQALLRPDEAMVAFLDTPAERPTSEETFIWVVTKTGMRWLRSDLGLDALIREVQALRCGLDEEEWATPTSAGRCAELLGLTEVPDASRPLPFDLGRAHALYEALFGGAKDLIAGKRLLIVPSGALTSLPFQVLVTKKPARALPGTFAGYRGVAWLGRQNAIATLPAVSSLKALRRPAAHRRRASADYAGYGNPVLNGDGASCRLPKVPGACPAIDAPAPRRAPVTAPMTAIAASRALIRGGGGRRSVNVTVDAVFANGSTSEAVLEQVRGLCPLPDTAYEIECVASRFKAKTRLVRLEGEASEGNLKALSASGALAGYGVLHFATHGLLSGDVERMARRRGEPALVMTPPERPADADDDGLLMASEVAGLKLNADWVVLSACNTAAGNAVGAQALSGLARAFFFAGGRALLVSHWPVYSDAAVRLTTGTFAALDRNPKGGRAEALRQAMIGLMDDRSQADNAHPAVWAPFAVVGEGGR